MIAQWLMIFHDFLRAWDTVRGVGLGKVRNWMMLLEGGGGGIVVEV